MKKLLVCLLLFSLDLFSLELRLNSATDNGQKYAILHLEHSEPISCVSKNEPFNKKSYVCMFEGIAQGVIKDKQTSLVDIDFIQRKDQYYIYIRPKVYSHMENFAPNIYQSTTLPFKDAKVSTHWAILIYKNNPFADKRPKNALNFPVTYDKEQFPFIGALDLNSKPIDYISGQDMQVYLNIKRSFEDKDYERVLELANKASKKYINSIFISDILMHKLKALDHLEDDPENKIKIDRSEIISEVKKWLDAFPGDTSTPEAVHLLVKSYLIMGFNKDAYYYMDSLMTHYPDATPTQKAILFYADSLYKNKKIEEAVKLYEKVLYNSKDINTASQAVMSLTKYALTHGEKQKAQEYLQKLLNANSQYIHKHQKTSYQLAEQLAQNELFSLAATISKILLSNTKAFSENYEMLLKDVGIYSQKAKLTAQAYEYLKLYEKQFNNGTYSQLVRQSLDRLFFDLNETNSTKLLAYYDTLIGKYKNDISQKATLQKAKLLLKKGHFSDVLAMQDSLKDINASFLIKKARKLGLHYYLSQDDCINANTFLLHDPTLLNEIANKELIFSCFMRTKNFKDAHALAKDQASNSSDLQDKLSWLLKLQSASYSQNDYSQTIQIAKDIKKLGSILQSPEASYALYDHFLALFYLKDYENALQIAKEISSKLEDNFQNIEIYDRIISMAKDKNDDAIVIIFAKKALDLQEKYQDFILSPKLEFSYISSLHNLGEYDKSLNIINNVLKLDLNEEDKTHAIYIKANTFLKLNDKQNAKKYFSQCSKMQSTWGKICLENLKLFSK